MQYWAAQIIKATSLLDGSCFHQAMVFITEHNQQGATGFVINKPFGKNLNELVEFSNSRPIALYDGGPVEKESLFFMHQRPDIIEGGKPIGNGSYVGGNFKQAVASINKGLMQESQIKIFIGYCGWDTGELEAEVEEGSWELASNHLGYAVF